MKNAGSKLNMDLAACRGGLTSAKLPPKKGSTKTGGGTSDFTVPSILKPLLDEHIGKKKAAKRDDSYKPSKKHG